MKNKIRIFLIDDHQIIRDGLRILLNQEKDLEIAGESDGCKSDLQLIFSNQPDVILMDISLRECSGIELSQILLSENKPFKIIILSMFNDPDSVFKAIDVGVSGYLSKNSASSEILSAIRTVADGKTYFNREISEMMMNNMIETRKTSLGQNDQPCIDCLTQREREILKYFSLGQTNNEIASKLNISIRTVESHKTHIMQKLGFKTIVDLVKFALRNNIAEL
jgi:two-component system, NarL family, response regulator NreC